MVWYTLGIHMKFRDSMINSIQHSPFWGSLQNSDAPPSPTSYLRSVIHLTQYIQAEEVKKNAMRHSLSSGDISIFHQKLAIFVISRS